MKMNITERKNSGSVFQIHTRPKIRNIVSPDPTLLEFHQGCSKAPNCEPNSLVFDQDRLNMLNLKSVRNKVELSEHQKCENSVPTPIQLVKENVSQVNEESKDLSDLKNDTGHETESENKRIDHSTPKIFQENPKIDVHRLSEEEIKANSQVMYCD